MMHEQPKPPDIRVFCKPGRVAVTADGMFIGTVTYDIENPANLPLLAAAFANAVASTTNRVQPVGAQALVGINGSKRGS